MPAGPRVNASVSASSDWTVLPESWNPFVFTSYIIFEPAVVLILYCSEVVLVVAAR